MGPKQHLPKATKLIGRHIRFTLDGIDLDVDQGYVDSAFKAYGLEGSSSVSSPAVKDKVETNEERTDILLRRLLEKGWSICPRVSRGSRTPQS